MQPLARQARRHQQQQDVRREPVRIVNDGWLFSERRSPNNDRLHEAPAGTRRRRLAARSVASAEQDSTHLLRRRVSWHREGRGDAGIQK